MTEAGFTDVRVEQIEAQMRVESSEDLWTMMLGAAPAVAGLLGSASEAQREATRSELGKAFRSRFGEGPAEVPFTFNVGIGAR